MPVRKIKAGPLERSYTFQREAINEEARTIEVAFSSEEPVERWFGKEILDHAPNSVRLGRLQDGGAVLVGHDHDDHVGVVESATIDSDRRGRATVRFGNGALAVEKFNDVKDGILRHISVGYRIHELTLNKTGDDGDEYRATDWEPYEISFVSVPADATVGVGRSSSDVEENTITVNEPDKPEPEETTTIQEERTMPPENQAPAVQTNSDELLTAERSRINKINELARKYQLTGEAEKAVNDGITLEDFRGIVLDKLNSDTRTDTNPVTHIDMGKKDVQRYSLLKALRACETGDWSGATLEREASFAVADALGKDARGFYVPYDVQMRDMTTGAANAGSELVGTDHLGGSFIDALRGTNLAMMLGADVLTGLVGNVDIPAADGDGTYYWIDEGEDGTESNIPTRTVALSPKTIAGAVAVTRRLLKQSDPSVEAMLMRQMQLGASIGIDNAVFAGVAKGPTGILKTTGVNTTTIATAGKPTWAELVDLETKCAADDALVDNMAYVGHSNVIGHCKSTPRDAGSGLMLMEGSQINGYNAYRKNGLAAGDLLFGNFADVVIGMWGVLDIVADKSTKAASGGLVMRVFQDVDAEVKRAQSFAKVVTA
ncbi:phage major capsid protein [Endozoicomonas ascidiicola]|uniref:phage major capsid protein n=1 Tax=Endozoicomonas ascidiicola TaxID=1698521 RepID=UPI00082B7D16|nr:phage major capsid protein [Endozoicomonas ascidiicola]